MKKIPAFIGAAALAISLASCSSTPQQVAAVCVDPQTNMRVDDSMCNSGVSPYFIPWYITAGYTIPAYGYPVAYGYAHPPSHVTIIHAPSAGGVITRRSTFSSSRTPQTIQPTSASTQAPPPKRTWGSKPVTTTKPVTQTAPQTQSKPRWNTYPQSKPAAPRPPSYTQYRSSTTTRTSTRYR